MAWLTASFPFTADEENAFTTILPQDNDTDGFFIARLKRGSE
jgi:16S rRNA C967 or C1407 C5-methylase (RsmB/RsmF family)